MASDAEDAVGEGQDDGNGNGSGPDTERLTDAVYETVGQPVSSAALFYALLYLVEIENVDALRREFHWFRQRLSHGFFWYGVYAVLSEVAAGSGSYHVDGNPVSYYIVDHRDGDEEAVIQHADRDLGDGAFFMSFFRHLPSLNRLRGREREAYAKTLNYAAVHFNAKADPKGFLADARRFFEITPQLRNTPVEYGWSPGYDGPAWVSVCEHLERREELPETSWVDMSWGIEHNNSRFIDKIRFQPAERRRVGEVLRERFGREVSGEASHGEMTRTLNDVLDAARATELQTVFTWAIESQDRLDVRLDRHARRAGIEWYTGEETTVRLGRGDVATLDWAATQIELFNNPQVVGDDDPRPTIEVETDTYPHQRYAGVLREFEADVETKFEAVGDIPTHVTLAGQPDRWRRLHEALEAAVALNSEANEQFIRQEYPDIWDRFASEGVPIGLYGDLEDIRLRVRDALPG